MKRERGGATAIIAAMPEELAPLHRRLRGAQRRSIRGLSALTGSIGATPSIVLCCGEGAERAADAVQTLLETQPVCRCLFLGTAGGLDPGLVAGSILLARDVLHRSGRAAPGPDPAWLDAAPRLAGTPAGTLVAVDDIITSAATKEALWQQRTGHEPAAADLESFAYAQTAAAAGTPYLIARAISDTATESLPSFLAACQRGDRSVDRARVARLAFQHPRTIPRLLRLRSRVRLCAARLAHLTPALLDAAEGSA